ARHLQLCLDALPLLHPLSFFLSNPTPTPPTYTLSLHDALPISFLSSKEAVNERVITRPGAPTREEFAARVANEPTTMSFLAEPFEKFKRGETLFDCRAQCAFSYSRRTSVWKKLHDRKQWRDLA